MYRATFEAPMEYAKSRLENLTRSGSIEAVISIRSGTISDGEPFMITLKTEKAILDNRYRGKFTRGNYIVEFMRGLMRCTGWAARSDGGWTFGIMISMESSKFLQDNITMAATLQTTPEGLSSYLDGTLNIEKHVATLLSAAEKKNPNARNMDGPAIVELAAEILPQTFIDAARETGHGPVPTEEQAEKMKEMAEQMADARKDPEKMKKVFSKLTSEAGVDPEMIAKVTADLAGEDADEVMAALKEA